MCVKPGWALVGHTTERPLSIQTMVMAPPRKGFFVTLEKGHGSNQRKKS